jgi:hypothetical protein
MHQQTKGKQVKSEDSYLGVRDSKITSYVGPDAVQAFRALTIASGLRLYAKTGMKPNRAYTPTAMLKAATGITGKTYKRGAYVEAADDLQSWANEMKAALPIVEAP